MSFKKYGWTPTHKCCYMGHNFWGPLKSSIQQKLFDMLEEQIAREPDNL
jgi:hypothetical protein